MVQTSLNSLELVQSMFGTIKNRFTTGLEPVLNKFFVLFLKKPNYRFGYFFGYFSLKFGYFLVNLSGDTAPKDLA